MPRVKRASRSEQVRATTPASAAVGGTRRAGDTKAPSDRSAGPQSRTPPVRTAPGASPGPLLRIRLGAAVRRLRDRAGYGSQEAFADAAGVHRTYAGKVERGEVNITLDNLERLARTLGVSAGELLVEAERGPPA
jgi:ribosome-binding protein aMBF1 (putative translation factor)